MTTAEELEAARLDVERAIERWAQLRAAHDDEQREEGQAENGLVAVTAAVWAAECASISPDLDGYSLRWVGVPRSQGVSASAGLGLYITKAYT